MMERFQIEMLSTAADSSWSDGVNREALWQVLKMYDVGGKLLSGIKSLYVDSSACVRVKSGGLR